jgi:hypothetical protein
MRENPAEISKVAEQEAAGRTIEQNDTRKTMSIQGMLMVFGPSQRRLRRHLVCSSSKVLDEFVHRAREDSNPETVAEAKS